MRTLLLIALAGLALAPSARAGDMPRLAGPPLPASAPAPGLAARRDAPGAGPTYVSLPPAGASPAATPPGDARPDAAATAPPVRAPRAARAIAPVAAAPWCSSGRVVGTGDGFCMVN